MSGAAGRPARTRLATLARSAGVTLARAALSTFGRIIPPNVTRVLGVSPSGATGRKRSGRP
jgi:hypothetical protein